MFAFTLAAACSGAAGCVAALGPGYTIEKQELRVHLAAESQPRILLDAQYSLKNTGNQPLSSLELRLPGRRRFHAVSPHAEWGGGEVTLEPSPYNPRDTIVNLPAPWKVSVTTTLHLSAQFVLPEPSESSLRFTSDAFFLPAEGWSPELLPARGLFSTGGVPPDRWDLLVQVPQDFLVHTSGNAGKSSRVGDEILIRATQRPQDRYPFVVAGHYQSMAMAGGEKTFLWTRKPQTAADLTGASEALLRAVHAFDTNFGVRANPERPLWIVECPSVEGCFSPGDSAYAKLLGEADESTSAEMVSFDTVVADVSGGPLKLAGVVAPSLAASWLGYGQNPGYYEVGPPLYALPRYAAGIGREAVEGAAVREETIRGVLQAIARANQLHSAEAPAVLRAKCLLFFYALQERYGQESFGKALRHMLEARRGRGFDLDDLISAVEQETHQNAAEFVRLWMKHPGVPAEFRARHEESPAAAVASP